jgi:hypothetical protein
VRFAAAPGKTEKRDHWKVVLEYAEEGGGPHLADLSHIPRWDLQDGDLGRFQPGGADIPKIPGSCAFSGNLIINRMNRTQAALWHLADADKAAFAPDSAYTDVTEASVCLALFGPDVFSITEKLTALDFFQPGKTPPFLLQGPFSQVPCQIVVLDRDRDSSGGILLTCSRGYARDMADAILSAGDAFGLHPAGEETFLKWLKAAQKHPGNG